MKFLLVSAFYPVYLDYYLQHHAIAADATASNIVSDLLEDQFSACHDWAREFTRRGWDAQYWIANFRPAVDAHRRDRGRPPCRDARDEDDTLVEWIDEFRPDVLFLGDPIRFDSKFLARLGWRPPVVAAWRAAATPPEVDWHGIDLLFSHLTTSREDALRRGARRVEFFHPGFPLEVGRQMRSIQAECDAVFTGQWSQQHTGRNGLLHDLARAVETTHSHIDLRFHLATSGDPPPIEVSKRDRGPKWAVEMLRTLRSGRICLNAEIDLAKGEAGNMRMFEATGVGAFLLTERHPNIERYFVPGVEIETYANSGEMLEKIDWYLRHPTEREAIAKTGHEACQERFSSASRAQVMERILLDAMPKKSSVLSMVPTTSSPATPRVPTESAVNRLLTEAEARFAAKDMRGAIELFQEAENLVPDSLEILNAIAWLKSEAGDLAGAQAQYLKVSLLHPKVPSSHANLAAILLRRGLPERAEKSLLTVLSLDPEHVDALLACARLRRDGGRIEESTPMWNRFLIASASDHPARQEAEAGSNGPRPRQDPSGPGFLQDRFPDVAFGTDVQILGLAESRIGAGSIVQDGTWLNVCIRDGRTRIDIGECTCIGRWNVLSSGGRIELGDYCLLGPNVYISDTDHVFADPFKPYVAQGVLTGGELVIEDNCWLGQGVGVLGSVRIGKGSVVGAHSLVLSDVEPFSVVVGTPARVVKMFDPVDGAWVPASTEEQRRAVREHRAVHPLPGREQYRSTLHSSGYDRIDPIIAGASRNL